MGQYWIGNQDSGVTLGFYPGESLGLDAVVALQIAKKPGIAPELLACSGATHHRESTLPRVAMPV